MASHINESESSSLAWPTTSVAGLIEGGVAKNVQMDEKGFSAMRENGTKYGAKLRDAVIHHEKNWATPQAFDSVNIVRTPEKLAQTRKEKNAGCMNLREQVHYPNMDHSRKNWSTPRAGAIDSTRPNKKGGIPLSQQAKETWSTPTARDFKDTPNDKSGQAMTLGRQVNGWQPKSQQDQPNLNMDGKPQESLNKGYLNPNWVEQLMGLPIGWTDFDY